MTWWLRQHDELPRKTAQAAEAPQIKQMLGGIDKWAPLSDEWWRGILELRRENGQLHAAKDLAAGGGCI